MKCPLFTIGRTDVQMGVESDYGECLGEGCAWWDPEIGQCSLVTMARQTHNIYSILDLIADKLPHAVQFTK